MIQLDVMIVKSTPLRGSRFILAKGRGSWHVEEGERKRSKRSGEA